MIAQNLSVDLCLVLKSHINKSWAWVGSQKLEQFFKSLVCLGLGAGSKHHFQYLVRKYPSGAINSLGMEFEAREEYQSARV